MCQPHIRRGYAVAIELDIQDAPTQKTTLGRASKRQVETCWASCCSTFDPPLGGLLGLNAAGAKSHFAR